MLTVSKSLILFLALCLLAACQDNRRIEELEKQTKELKAQLARQQVAADLELQAKCSKDAKLWFAENWRRDRNTLLLTYSNHYNTKLKRCFILVENHYQFSSPSWWNSLSLYDVYENSEHGHVVETHILHDGGAKEMVRVTGQIAGVECKTHDACMQRIQPYITD